MSEPITKEALLAGELDPEAVSLTDIMAFCAENDIDYDVSSEKEKKDILNDLCDILSGPVFEEVSVEQYADSFGCSIDLIKELTGLPRKNSKISLEIQDKLPGKILAHHALNDDAPPEKKDVVQDEGPAKPKEKPKSDFLSRRAKKIEQAKMRTGTTDGKGASGQDFPLEKYKDLPEEEYDKLPGRIRRNLERNDPDLKEREAKKAEAKKQQGK